MSERNGKDEMRFDIVEKLYRSEYPNMLSFASYLLSDKALAEVAVQDTFVCALQNIHKLEASSDQVGWLYNALKNIVRHMRRDRQFLIKNFIQLDETKEVPAAPPGQAKLLAAEGQNDPEVQLLVRFYIYGYSLKELAKEEGISVGAMKMRIKRAREHVRDKFIF